MEEITNQVWIQAQRMAAELVEKMTPELLDNELTHMDEKTKKEVCTQYMAKVIFDTFGETPEERG